MSNPLLVPAVDVDFDTEFIALTMAIKCVSSLNEAIEHINTHGSKHTDAIVTYI
jgi:glutamate-5-semialdehyde dehydrogenase